MADDQKSKAACKCGGKRGQNLVICIDGTSNKFGVKNTNVVEFYSLLNKDKTQKTFYSSGIGTYATPFWKSLSYRLKTVNNFFDLLFAVRPETTVLEAYRWLSDHYEEGDSICLLGFSRGAYQVRVLAAMLETVGLIHRGNEAQIPFAFEVYAALTPERNYDVPNEESPENHARHFKKTFSRPVRVHFIGAWDTVSAIGLTGRNIFPRTTTGLSSVCFFRHALALDEQRVKYLPEHAYGATTWPPPALRSQNESDPLHIKEVWFVGSHSDIGGGLVKNLDMASNGPPLRWMSYEAIEAGIRMEIPGDRWISDPCNDPHDSLNLFWKVAGWLLAVPESHRERQNLGDRFGCYDGRRIMEGQKIHASVFAYLKPEQDGDNSENLSPPLRYHPKAQIHSSFSKSPSESELTWENLYEMQRKAEGSEEPLDWLENDILDWLTYTLKKIDESLRHGEPSVPKERYLELEKNSKKDVGRFALLLNEKNSASSMIFALFKDTKISDLQCLSSLMTTLLNFAAVGEELSDWHNDLYPVGRIDLFAKVGSLGSNSAVDPKPAKPAGEASIFARFFYRFSSGVGREYRIRKIGPNFVLSAGEIQGIYRDAKFTVYSDQDHKSVVGTAVVTSTRALTSVVSVSLYPVVLPGDYFTSCLPTFPGNNWALRVAFHSKTDGEFRLKMLKSLDGLRKESSKRLPVVTVADNEKPDFILSRGSLFDYSFEATDWKQYPGMESIKPDWRDLNPEYLADIVYGGALYYWYIHLPRATHKDWSQAIQFKWFKDPLSPTNYVEPSDQIGPIPIDGHTEYGCKITNITEDDLYAHVLTFDLTSHEIVVKTYNEDLNAHPIRPRSSIILGNSLEDSEKAGDITKWRGRSFGPFEMPEGQEKNVTYLAILLSKSYTDYTVSYIPSPFSAFFDFQKAWEEKPTVQPWKTILIPIYQERAEPNSDQGDEGEEEEEEEEEGRRGVESTLNEEVTASSFPPESIPPS